MQNYITKILLVEDNSGDAYLLKEALHTTKNLKFELSQADNLSETLRILSKQEIDIVLLDLSLPDSSGFSTFSHVYSHATQIPIIVLTGSDDDELAARTMQNGAQDYLIKGTFSEDLLARSIRYSIERHNLLVEMEKARLHEQHLAYHDVLTSLPNRLLFYDRLDQALIHAKRYAGMLGILFLDLDGFKQINDTKGHSQGDRLLQIFAERLKKNVRESDTIARLGGDEFTILLKGISAVDDIAKVGMKVLEVTKKPFLIGNENKIITCSIGASIFPYDGNNTEALIKKADLAMYKAKSLGKNTFHLYNAEIDKKNSKRQSLENKLRYAIENNHLLLHFQPLVSLRTGEISGLEALVRWNDPELGLILPSEFIPLAEDTGLIMPLGEWVLKSACTQNKIWQTSGYKHLPISINLSARQFREVSIVETIHCALKEVELEPEFLKIEITETHVMQDVDYAISTLEILREMGILVALDDFGTGYSSLSYLKRLPIDQVKIDKSFINDIPGNPHDAAILTAIATMAQTLGIKVVAEGVENKRQLHFLQSIECDIIQGYYFCRPLPTSELLAFIDSGKKLELNYKMEGIMAV